MPPTLRVRRRPGSGGGRSAAHTPARVVVVGDLMLDVVVAPARALARATDVPGRVSLRQGGSAANTARWVARLGARSTLVCAVGRDAEGRALVAALEADGVRVRAARVAGERTGRIGVVVEPGGERSFVADRRAADRLQPTDLAVGAFAVDLLHLPAYSLLGDPLGRAGRRAVELARAAGALVSLDLSSVGPLLAGGRRSAQALIRAIGPDVLFATRSEIEGLLGRPEPDRLAGLAGVVVVKHGRAGASVTAGVTGESPPLTFDVATSALATDDSTGAGDAFDAGFLVAWLGSPPGVRCRPTALRRAVLAGHRAAARQLSAPKRELAR